ncbi:MAG TPA: glycoside hydrolase family 65 protein [Clostridiales bacterium]|nr:glycoside hydrolase family 65 protein [Clostridiales bacterium]
MGLKQLVYEIEEISLDNRDLIVNETVFHNANGYIGIRSNFEEGYPEGYDTIRGSYINGFYDIAEMSQAEKLYGLVEEKQTMLNVADTQTIRLTVDGEKFSLFEGRVLSGRRWLDMEKGVSKRAVQWRSPSGKEIEITITRMASFHQLSLFTIEYGVKALNFKGNLEFESFHYGKAENYSNENDPRVAKESGRYLVPAEAEMDGGESYLTSHTSKSGLSVCTGVAHRLSKECRIVTSHDAENHCVVSNMELPIDQNERVTLIKYTVFGDSIRNPDLTRHVKEEMKKALGLPLSYYYEEQKAYLLEFWSNCMLMIEGDDALNEAVNYNMYQLVQSVGKDEYCNITAKGLSGEGYEGHYFWDTEMYIEPFFNLTEPAVTKNLISFRYNTLKQAKENARLLGHAKGALYPWRTIMGIECSGYFPSGTAGYHINGDIAYSIVTYYLATKDLDFIANKGAEIIFETARLWMDVGNYREGSFRINEVTGPDEYTCMVNNNYYTNVSAQYNLSWAYKFYYMLEAAGWRQAADRIGLTEQEVIEFKQAADAMYLPYDSELGINPQDDSFLDKKLWDLENTPREKFPLLLHYHPLHLYRHQVCKQADTVLAHFIFEDAQPLEVIRNSFAYYEKVTTHDSSLSTCIFSIMASKLGLEEKAYEYFGDSAKLDLFNTHKNTKDGIHTANMGGTYMAIVYGFAGLRIKESGLYFAPAIPKQWEGYKFQIRYEDSLIRVEVEPDKSVFTLVKGTGKTVYVYGDSYILTDQFVVPRKHL